MSGLQDCTSYQPQVTGSTTAIGQLDTLTYPTSTASYRLKLKYEYQYGLLKRVKDFNATTVFWTANDTDPRGSVIDESLGNGLLNRGFVGIPGRLGKVEVVFDALTQGSFTTTEGAGHFRKRGDATRRNVRCRV